MNCIDGEIGAELASNRQLSVDWADFSHFVDFENVFTEDEYDQGDGGEDDFDSEGHAHPEDIGIGVVAGWTFGDLAAGAMNEARIAEFGVVPETWNDIMTATYSGFEFSQTISYLQYEFGFEVLKAIGHGEPVGEMPATGDTTISMFDAETGLFVVLENSDGFTVSGD